MNAFLRGCASVVLFTWAAIAVYRDVPAISVPLAVAALRVGVR